VFEQSLILDQGAKRPWNFLVSLSAELFIISLALLIPLLYRDHLPVVHWKDIIVGPAPLPPALPPATHESAARNSNPSMTLHRTFHWDLTASPAAAQTSSAEFVADAPPALGPGLGVGGATNNIGTFIPNYVAGPPPSRPPVEHKPPMAPVPVGGDVQMAMLIRKVIPVYPPLARSARISGVVHLIGTIGKDGKIQNLQVVSGHPMLTRAALQAVEQWIYKPTLLNGNPVEVIAPIEVNFILGQ
jgi:periplasmic protein TonB